LDGGRGTVLFTTKNRTTPPRPFNWRSSSSDGAVIRKEYAHPHNILCSLPCRFIRPQLIMWAYTKGTCFRMSAGDLDTSCTDWSTSFRTQKIFNSPFEMRHLTDALYPATTELISDCGQTRIDESTSTGWLRGVGPKYQSGKRRTLKAYSQPKRIKEG